jgi:phosphatidylglycerol:prolipoprotein diacylglycerol transferase
MIHYPVIDPIAVHIAGPLSIYWYGLMYLFSFIVCWGILGIRLRQSSLPTITAKQLSDILFYSALGIIIGGRIGYMLFYKWSDWISHPWLFFQVWQGGMSFHGGLIGVIFALGWYASKTGKSVVDITDFIAPVVPIGLAAGRIGNFINGELWGRVTDVPWAMIFPQAGSLPRHPSQLYECLLEGIVMFAILWFFSRKPQPRGAVSGLFLLCYGLFRVGVEFFREPDAQIGFMAFGWLTKGQLLSLPMLILGGVMLGWAYTHNSPRGSF